jgi:hypothetical protein
MSYFAGHCRFAKRRLPGWTVWRTGAAGVVAVFVIGPVVWPWWAEVAGGF